MAENEAELRDKLKVAEQEMEVDSLLRPTTSCRHTCTLGVLYLPLTTPP